VIVKVQSAGLVGDVHRDGCSKIGIDRSDDLRRSSRAVTNLTMLTTLTGGTSGVVRLGDEMLGNGSRLIGSSPPRTTLTTLTMLTTLTKMVGRVVRVVSMVT
jgi:hypothetical protein